MSSPNPIISPTTSAVTVQLQTESGDQVVIYLSGTWGALETCTVRYPTSAGGLVDYIDPTTSGPIALSSGGPVSWVLPGGFLYTLVKTATVGAGGVDVQYKPRQGPH
jgi:hypothetical protein